MECEELHPLSENTEFYRFTMRCASTLSTMKIETNKNINYGPSNVQIWRRHDVLCDIIVPMEWWMFKLNVSTIYFAVCNIFLVLDLYADIYIKFPFYFLYIKKYHSLKHTFVLPFIIIVLHIHCTNSKGYSTTRIIFW